MSDKEKSCCFFGNILVLDTLKPKLQKAVRSAVEEGYRIFYVGRYGAYDREVLSVLKEEKAVFPEIEIRVVLRLPPEAKKEMISERTLSDALMTGTMFFGEAGFSFKERIVISARKTAHLCSLAICDYQEGFDDTVDAVMRFAQAEGLKIINLMRSINYADL